MPETLWLVLPLLPRMVAPAPSSLSLIDGVVVERLELAALPLRLVLELLLLVVVVVVVVEPAGGVDGVTAGVLVLVSDSVVLASGVVPALLMLVVLVLAAVLVAAFLLPQAAVASAAPISRAVAAVRVKFGIGTSLA